MHTSHTPQLLRLEDRTLPGDTLLGLLAFSSGLTTPAAREAVAATASAPSLVAPLPTTTVSGGETGTPAPAAWIVDPAADADVFAAEGFTLNLDESSEDRSARHFQAAALPNLGARGLGEAVMNVPGPRQTTHAVPAATVSGWSAAPAQGMLEQLVGANLIAPPAGVTEGPGVASAQPTCSSPPAGGDTEWNTYQHDAAHTGRSEAQVDAAGLQLAWRAPQGYSIPIIAGGNIISMRNQQGVGGDVTTVRSFRLSDGAVNWTYTNEFVFPGHPTYAEGLVVFAASPRVGQTQLWVLDAADGRLRYTVPLGGDGRVPTIHRNPDTGNLVAYVANGGLVSAVNLGESSGSVLWTGTGSFGGFSIPTVAGRSVILAGPGHYYAFDINTGERNEFHRGNISGGGGTTAAYDEALGFLYVLEDRDTSGTALTAYQYLDNSTIMELWQYRGPALRFDTSVAIGRDSAVYLISNTTLAELYPYDGSTLRSLGGLNIANQVTPALSNGYLWAFGPSQTFAFDLSTFSLARTLPGSRGHLNTAFRSPGALADGYFVLDYGNIYGSAGFDVYAAPPVVAQDNWETYQHDVFHTGCSRAFVDPAALRLAWSAPRGYSTPLVVGGSVYAMKNQQGIGNDMTLVSSFDLNDGRVQWTYQNRFVFPSQPTYAEGLVVFAATEFPINNPFQLFVLDAATGALKYTVRLSSSFDMSVMPTVVRNQATGQLMAYVATGGTLYAVELGGASGSVVWTGTGSFGGFSMPTVAGNSLILAGPGQFYAFDQTTGARNHFHRGDISGGGGTTVAYEPALSTFFVLETYDLARRDVLTAYYYFDNDTIFELWQTSGPGIVAGGSVAVGPDNKLYAADGTTLVEIDAYTGAILRSRGGQSFAAQMTPAVSNGYVWTFADTVTRVYDLSTLELVRQLPGSRGSLNSAYDSPGALTDWHFLLDYGTIYDRPGFDVYRGF